MAALRQRARIILSHAWRYAKKHRWIILACIFLFGLLAWGAYLRWVEGRGWDMWTGFGPYNDSEGKTQPGKTLWNLMELFIVPVILALGALLFNRQERQNEIRISEARNQEKILQSYFDQMNDLVLEKNLMAVGRLLEKAATEDSPTPTTDNPSVLLSDELRAVLNMARVRTVTALRQVDGGRREIIFQFLRDAGMGNFILTSTTMSGIDLGETDMRGINLAKADLMQADLHGANLCSSDLRGADLQEADLSEASLGGADLSGAKLGGALLSRAWLGEANLRYANLGGAILIGTNMWNADLYLAYLGFADLKGADLTGAKVTDEQLAMARTLVGMTMPDGRRYSPAIHTFWKKQPEGKGD